MDGLSFHPYPDQAIDPLERGYRWPKAGFANLDRIKQAIWDAFRRHAAADDRERPQALPRRGGLAGRHLDADRLHGHRERPRHRRRHAGAASTRELVHDAACDPQIAEVNIFGFYDDGPRDSGFQAALNHVDGTPRASAAAVQAAIADSAAGCARDARPGGSREARDRRRGAGLGRSTGRGRRSASRRPPTRAPPSSPASFPGALGGVATAALMAKRTATSPGCTRRQGDAAAPGRVHDPARRCRCGRRRWRCGSSPRRARSASTRTRARCARPLPLAGRLRASRGAQLQEHHHEHREPGDERHDGPGDLVRRRARRGRARSARRRPRAVRSLFMAPMLGHAVRPGRARSA